MCNRNSLKSNVRELERVFPFKQIKLPYILALAAIFFSFMLILLLRSFPAELHIYQLYSARSYQADPFWNNLWFGSELTGEVGLVIRFLGALSLLTFVLLLWRRRQFITSHLGRAVLFEGIYYLFMIPFILSLYFRPNTGMVNLEAALSYTLQILLVTPAFLWLFFSLRKTNVDSAETAKRGAVAIIAFTFALYIKHLLLMLYALPVSLSTPVLAAGTLNSTLTILAAGLLLLAAFLPLIKKQSFSFNTRLAGAGLLLIGLFFVVYFVVALFSQRYWDFMMLTELWGVGFLILGASYQLKRPRG